MRRDAFLGDPVHVRGADLDLDALALRPDHRRVERLVHVRLGDRDEVLEAPGHRLPEGVDQPERLVALAHARREDPERGEVVDLVELPARLHLLVDREEVLRAPGDLPGDPDLGQLLREDRDDLVDLRLALQAALGHPPLEVFVGLGMEGLQRQIFQLALHLRHAQPVGERRVDVEGLLGDPALLLGAKVVEGAHVVEAVGQLDQDDPDVPGHGHQHLAEVLGLPLLPAREGQLADLGDAVDELGDIVAEPLDQDGLGGGRVLQHVVEEPRGDRRRVHPELDQEPGDGQGVDVVGLARDPPLAAVHLLGELVGPPHDVDVPPRLVAGDLGQEVAQSSHVRPRPGPPPGPPRQALRARAAQAVRRLPGWPTSLPAGARLHHGLFAPRLALLDPRLPVEHDRGGHEDRGIGPDDHPDQEDEGEVAEHLAAEDEEHRHDQEHRQRGQDRPGQGLVDGGVDHVGQGLALPEPAAPVLPDPVERHDRVVDREADDGEERGQHGQGHLAMGQGHGSDGDDDVVHEGQDGRHAPLEIEPERRVEEDADHPPEHGLNGVALQVPPTWGPTNSSRRTSKPGRPACRRPPSMRLETSSSVPRSPAPG